MNEDLYQKALSEIQRAEELLYWPERGLAESQARSLLAIAYLLLEQRESQCTKSQTNSSST